MIAGDYVAWIGTIVTLALIFPIAFLWWHFHRKFKREEEEKKNKWKKKK